MVKIELTTKSFAGIKIKDILTFFNGMDYVHIYTDKGKPITVQFDKKGIEKARKWIIKLSKILKEKVVWKKMKDSNYIFQYGNITPSEVTLDLPIWGTMIYPIRDWESLLRCKTIGELKKEIPKHYHSPPPRCTCLEDLPCGGVSVDCPAHGYFGGTN